MLPEPKNGGRDTCTYMHFIFRVLSHPHQLPSLLTYIPLGNDLIAHDKAKQGYIFCMSILRILYVESNNIFKPLPSQIRVRCASFTLLDTVFFMCTKYTLSPFFFPKSKRLRVFLEGNHLVRLEKIFIKKQNHPQPTRIPVCVNGGGPADPTTITNLSYQTTMTSTRTYHKR